MTAVRSNTPIDLSEIALADAFVEARVKVDGYRWVQCWGRWLQWNGVVWEEDQTVEVYDDVRLFLKEYTSSLPDKERKALCSASTVSAVERLVRADRAAAAVPDQFDSDPWILNTPFEVVELKTGNARSNRQLDYCSKITAASMGGECPRWFQFLEEVTAGDDQLQGFLKRVAGYCLTGSTQEHAFLFLWGTGANGKGVFLNTLRGILNTYAKVAPIETFTESKGDRHPTDLAMLQGARLVLAQETEEGRRWSEAKIKTLTGGDPISARFMRADFFEYVPASKLIIAGNHEPALSNVDEAMRRRLHLVPFTVTIPPEKRDPKLTERLKEEWPGILQWEVEGCLDYLEVGLDPPDAVMRATDEYFETQDTLTAWLDEKCEQSAEAWEFTSVLYKSWCSYADGNGFRPGSQKALAAKLEARGFEKGRDRARGRFWKGLKVRPAEVGP